MNPADTAIVLSIELIDEASQAATLDQEVVEAIANFVFTREERSGSWEVTVALVSDDRLRALHAQFMGLDTITDVMTFPYDVAHGIQGGDIVISVDRATEQGPANGLTAEAELLFLVVHGLLHLCGWDDDTTQNRDAMLERQQDLIAAFGRGDSL